MHFNFNALLIIYEKELQKLKKKSFEFIFIKAIQ